MEKIGILGSGIVGQTLAKGFKKYGHEVMMASRDKSKVDQWVQESGEQVLSGTYEEAGQYADILVLCCLGEAAEMVLDSAGTDNLKGKIVIDATNPIDHNNPPKDGVLNFFTRDGESLMGRLQVKAADAKFVKAFNSIGNVYMVDPEIDGQKPTMFICGNDADAKSRVTDILETFGHEVEDMGSVQAAGVIESLCILWCIPGFLRNQWMHGFKLLKG